MCGEILIIRLNTWSTVSRDTPLVDHVLYDTEIDYLNATAKLTRDEAPSTVKLESLT